MNINVLPNTVSEAWQFSYISRSINIFGDELSRTGDILRFVSVVQLSLLMFIVLVHTRPYILAHCYLAVLG